jgi:hypothetical protein
MVMGAHRVVMLLSLNVVMVVVVVMMGTVLRFVHLHAFSEFSCFVCHELVKFRLQVILLIV